VAEETALSRVFVSLSPCGPERVRVRQEAFAELEYVNYSLTL